jgi:hypothetical protein
MEEDKDRYRQNHIQLSKDIKEQNCVCSHEKNARWPGLRPEEREQNIREDLNAYTPFLVPDACREPTTPG